MNSLDRETAAWSFREALPSGSAVAGGKVSAAGRTINRLSGTKVQHRHTGVDLRSGPCDEDGHQKCPADDSPNVACCLCRCRSPSRYVLDTSELNFFDYLIRESTHTYILLDLYRVTCKETFSI